MCQRSNSWVHFLQRAQTPPATPPQANQIPLLATTVSASAPTANQPTLETSSIPHYVTPFQSSPHDSAHSRRSMRPHVATFRLPIQQAEKALEAEYNEARYPKREVVADIASGIGYTRTEVEKWFAERRRRRCA